MAKWRAVLVAHALGLALTALADPAPAQETKSEEPGQEQRPIPLPEQP